MAKYKKAKTPKELAKVEDKDIDFTDIPELDESFWDKAEIVEPDHSVQITIRLKQSVIDHFKKSGTKGYQTRINKVLESYVRAQQDVDR